MPASKPEAPKIFSSSSIQITLHILYWNHGGKIRAMAAPETVTVVSFDTPWSVLSHPVIAASVDAQKISNGMTVAVQTTPGAGNSGAGNSGAGDPVPVDVDPPIEPSPTLEIPDAPFLTSIFTPPTACFTDIYGYPSSSLSIFPYNYETIQTCYPQRERIWFSPGLCPSGFQWVGVTIATGVAGVPGALKSTRATCCPV